MDHSEAVEQMATERYLLNELSPDAREAFEDHVFDCPECALDLRAGAAFVTEAKVQLPDLIELNPARTETSKPATAKRAWVWRWPSFLSSPAFAAPVFASLLLILGYQNLVTYPALRAAADEPQILPWTSLHTATRGEVHVPVVANKRSGAMLLIDLPQEGNYSSYAVDLAGPDGKARSTRNVSSTEAAAHEGTVSLRIPGAELGQGAYTLTVFGVAANGQRTEVQRHILDLQVQ